MAPRIFILLLLATAVFSSAEEIDIRAEPHRYWERAPQDPFSRLKPALESGKIRLDRSSEQAFLLSFLRLLDIPPSSQTLVFSTTSLQLSLISPRNPRALYFNEHTYVGFIPGGKLEIISLDPEFGGIFYIMDIPRAEAPIVAERSTRCMNCHSGADVRGVPGIVIKSVVPGPTGGSLDAFRTEETGHSIPFTNRFGGWYLTGASGISNHWANTVGRFQGGQIVRRDLAFGEEFDLRRYPVPVSDLLPHLIQEHQAGFVNRVLEGGYRARAALHAAKGGASVDRGALATLAREIARYILFADEAALPAPVQGDPDYRRDFSVNRLPDAAGRSLKDLDLQSRMFKYRCSYMIYSPLFTSLPGEFKTLVVAEIHAALDGRSALGSHLPEAERAAIRTILAETHPDFQKGT